MSKNNNAAEAENILDSLDMIPKIEKLVTKAVLDLYGESVVSAVKIEATIPADMRWGDYTTNISMLLGPVLKQSPLEIAKKLQYRISQLLEDTTYHGLFGKISVASPGYINFEISEEWLQNLLVFLSPQSTSYRVQNNNLYSTTPSLKNNLLAGKKIMVEYTDPNPFKVFHIGHLMPNTVGECLARMFEFCGAEVKRASYQGDVGMHVAKSIWGMLNRMTEANLSLEDLDALPLDERMLFLGKCYVAGAEEYKRDSSFITQINALVYVTAQELLQKQYGWQSTVDYKEKLSVKPIPDAKRDALIRKLYEAGRSWSLAYFETLYKILGTKFDYYYFESMAGEYGYKLVSEFLDQETEQKVFERDNGAVIFRGENYGLHTRVFINAKGLPTYEAKDLGLPFLKQKDYDYDLSYIVTASEQSHYFQVVFKALELINPVLAEKTHHVAHGMLNLTTGKMSSRTGDVISADELINQLSKAISVKMEETSSLEGAEEKEEISQKIAVAALKYAILKQQLGKDITYDREKSLQLLGDTGPYLQYSYVRAFSVLEKANFSWESFSLTDTENNLLLDQREMLLLRQLSHFQEIVLKATRELAPSYICTYLHDLASKFNAFYAESPIISEQNLPKRNSRLALTNAFCVVIKAGLEILGISVINKM